MPLSRLEFLFDRYVDLQCTAGEEEELMRLLLLPENEAALEKLIERLVEGTGAERKMPDPAAAVVLQNILQRKTPVRPPVKRMVLRPWARAAAIIFVLLSSAVLWNDYRKPKVITAVVDVAKQPVAILPGSDKAVLTLADGRKVALDDAKADTFRQAEVKIKSQPGLLSYHSTGGQSRADAPVAYNMLTTPRGGQYRVVLADGTKVWLNAASTLQYPTAFTGSGREVRLTGEAYFEVAKDKQRPFLVTAGDMKVDVLGTHFDINAYPGDKSAKTSLLEGSVKVTKGAGAALLRPGQQAVMEQGKGVRVADADMDEVIAWKNGLFQFDGADINTIMQQIGRWYDVEVVYGGKVPDNRFEGKISRSAQLSDVLEILALSNIKFSVEGKKIIVK
jgi:ferric-dicitrate binding protein FerR (iron transport regulator)